GAIPGQRAALITIAHNSEGVIFLQRQSEVLRRLRAEPELTEFSQLLPTVLAEGATYIVEQPAVGKPGQLTLGDDRWRARALVSAARAITALHSRTACRSTIDEAWLRDWIDRPIGLIETAAWRELPAEQRNAAFAVIRRTQHAAWSGRTLLLGWSHGDFTPTN